MAKDRLIGLHEGHSRKVTSLSDQHYRVWQAYKLAADDYGVMLFSPAPIQGVDLSLERLPLRVISLALAKLLDIRLLRPFEHQSRRYVFSPVWQTFQKIKYPTQTHLPAPPEPILQECDEKTGIFFAERFSKIDPALKERLLDFFQPSRARNANANANALREGEPERGSPEEIAGFWDAWLQLWSEAGSPHRLTASPKELEQIRKLLVIHNLQELIQIAKLLIDSPAYASKCNIGFLHSEAHGLARWSKQHPGVPYGAKVNGDQPSQDNWASLPRASDFREADRG